MSDQAILENKQTKMPTTVWMIGLMMFMACASYVMIYTFCGVYLKDIAGVSIVVVGFVEGMAEAVSFLLKLLSGLISDKMRHRKPLVIIGVALAALSRFSLALSPTVGIIVFSRLMERIGNGVQSTPRDALVGDITPPQRRGEAYGLKRMVAQAGSLFGALLGYVVMTYTNDDYLTVFWVACIPSFIALFILVFFVKEDKKHKTSAVTAEIPLPDEKRSHPFLRLDTFKMMGRSYWIIILVAGVFMLARFGETFMNFHAKDNFGLLPRFLPMVMVAYNAGHCIISYPAGYLADRMNRFWVLAIGILMLVLSDFCLATAGSMTTFFIGVFFWGIQFGITQNVFTTLIAEVVPENLRGTGFGIFYIVCAISCFTADGLAGKISHDYTVFHAYMYSGVMAIIALLFLMFAMGYRTKKS